MLKQVTVSSSLVKLMAVPAIWFAAAIAVSASGILYDPPRPLLPVLIWAPVLAFLVSYACSDRLRQLVLSLDLRWLVSFHLVRAPIGVTFLLMEAAGNLPSEFAIKAGVGDIVVGITAIFAMVCIPLLSTLRTRTVLVWNTLGLADILMVFVVAQRLLFLSGNPDALVGLTRFPILIVPTFVVPMILITHFVVFAQIWSNRAVGGHGGI